MLEYLQGLSLTNQIIIAVVLSVGLSNSLWNYLKGLYCIITGNVLNQSTLGRVIDWVWLGLVIYLVINLG